MVGGNPGRRVLPRQIVLNPEWMQDANCKGTDPVLFFGIEGDKYTAPKVIKEFCQPCKVRTQCLQAAWDNNEYFGIWGGTTPNMRATMRREKKANGRQSE